MRELIRKAQSQGWKATLRKAGHWKLTAPGGKGSVFMAQTPSDWRAVKNNISIMRRYGFDPTANPSRSGHAELVEVFSDQAEFALRSARSATDPKERLDGALRAIKFAAVAEIHAEGAKDWTEREKAINVAEEAVEILRKMLQSKNPADIPGGSMSACVSLMEARPDVESPGGLCNWLAQRAGESIGGGIRKPKKKLKPEQRKTLRRLMRI